MTYDLSFNTEPDDIPLQENYLQALRSHNMTTNIKDSSVVRRLQSIEPKQEDLSKSVLLNENEMILRGEHVEVSAKDNHAQHIASHLSIKGQVLSKTLRGSMSSDILEALEHHIEMHKAAKQGQDPKKV